MDIFIIPVIKSPIFIVLKIPQHSPFQRFPDIPVLKIPDIPRHPPSPDILRHSRFPDTPVPRFPVPLLKIAPY